MGDEEIRDDEERVAEEIEAEPETTEEAAEQRTDDYDGLARRLARRLDDIAEMLAARFDALDTAIGALGVSVVESGVTITDESDAAEAISDVLGIDALDLL